MKNNYLLFLIFIILSCSRKSNNNNYEQISQQETLKYDTISSVYLYLFNNYEDYKKQKYFDEGMFFDLVTDSASCYLMSGNSFVLNKKKGSTYNDGKKNIFDIKVSYSESSMYDDSGELINTKLIEKVINAIKDTGTSSESEKIENKE